MKVKFEIDYLTTFNQQVCMTGNFPEQKSTDKNRTVPLHCDYDTKWSLVVDIDNIDRFEYTYVIKEGERIVRKEWGKNRILKLDSTKNYYIIDKWRDTPKHKFLYTSAFTESFSMPEKSHISLHYFKDSILIRLDCPYADKNQEVILSGESDYLGNWNSYKAIPLQECAYGKWCVVLDASQVGKPVQCKFAILDKSTNQIIDWEEGNNRVLFPASYDFSGENIQIIELTYNRDWINWKAAGVAIPVFSLRSKQSSGIGEFTDLIPMIDWAKATGLKIIQVLPINDTTTTRKWTDSYPYNAISIYALNPVYLGLNPLPLKDKKLWKEIKKTADELNQLKDVDYEKVLAMKEKYTFQLFDEIGEEILNSEAFHDFLKKNEEWLFPYACFCYLRDSCETANHTAWGSHSRFNRKELQKLFLKDASMKKAVEMVYFTQYLLHIQLTSAKEYAHRNGIVLKGDIPIGISRDSADAWENPQLFNMNAQAGAPPDDFSVFGQNWGFPTYNWREMAKNSYSWWIKRFRKMADYFDIYRIDHILGFFRIWEIPLESVQGLLGYFSPALPYSTEEMKEKGFVFDEKRMTEPYIHEEYLTNMLGKDTAEFINNFLQQISPLTYQLKDFCNTQAKIKDFFSDKNDTKNSRFREVLYTLCNEVLFIRDKKQPNKFHPRITAQYSQSYKNLSEGEKSAFNSLYDFFFFKRHNEYWREQAMQKLPALISSTDMLVCGEDLGMIPESVPTVMRDLQILSLEIQRMPKDPNKKFENLNSIPYLSVCTTSTHDMSPIREWWHEDRIITQQYFNEILWKQGPAPEDCTPELCHQIILNHLQSPAILAIIPLQDWLSVDGKIRRENPYEERINIPALDQHYWRYRMHVNLEELVKAEDLNKEIKEMLKNSGRL